ncbi:Dipeptidyl-peptidase 5 [Penicillium digitatum Pd1]|uniref:Dipeptidyl-peptidase V n=1 Tax=Penicillium digitatum (strain Pd1 / CECT 20795) TaxID=1170230 RepID=K9F816_PEND1|nr:Dipeptidyl-peptidase 5 [Penicillium digitatum Pd1]EKV05244.1 Dipeptidyl-peptidase 5 [Penicillium digitatum Pd1]
MRVFPLTTALGSIFISAAALTPEELIAAPRRGEAIPNPSGEVALFSTSEYSFETHVTSSWWSLLDLETGKVTQLTNDSNVSELTWLGSTDSGLLYINGTNAETPGGTEIWVSDTSDFTTSAYKAASLPARLSGLKTATTTSGDINFLVYGESWPNGTAYNEELAAKPLSSARIYDSIYVRHWDKWITTRFNAIYSGTLKKKRAGHGATSSYTSSGSLRNLVAGVKNLESPYPPFGDSSDYDISSDGKLVAFKSKAPELPRANNTASYIFLVPHDGSRKAVAINGPDSPGTPKGIKGDSSSPVFSPDGRHLAYLQMEDISYESDRRTVYVYTIGSTDTIRTLAKNWDRSPGAIKWTADGKNLVLNTEDSARSRLFLLPADAGKDFKPKNFTDSGAVAAYYGLPDGDYLVSGSAIYTSRTIYTAKPGKGVTGVIFSANELDPALKSLGPSDIDEFYYKGNWTDIYSWIVYPSNFNKSKSYPLLFYIHGGPQGSWADSWSTRWNYKVFADQGYVVVAPNPTGSTGFGDELTDVIANNWGSFPYDDLVKGWEYVRDNLNFIDTDRGVAAGASYGGFMINWIQGNPLGREFKALVSHDGTFVADAKFNGTFWDNRDNYRRWDPSAPEHIKQFATPQLIVHSDLDYRLPISEGLALFNVLQERGIPSRLLSFPDENHWVINKENSLVWHQQVLGWLNKYAGIDTPGSSTTAMPPKPSSRKGAKKEIKTETSSPTPASVASGENESEYRFNLTPVPDPASAQFPCTEDDLTLCHAPTADSTGCPIFVSRNGRWDWYYLASNNNTTETSATPANQTTNGNSKNTKKSSPPKIKMEDIPEANPRVQRPRNPLSTTFPTDLDRFVLPSCTSDSDDDVSLVENTAEQARTAKHVRFFMNTTHDKHFVPIEVPPLTGNENWDSWLAAMGLLFRQHSVWHIVTAELQPLSPGHNLYMWYRRMCECAVALIYANVSEEVRKTPCFVSTVCEDNADNLITHLYAHYAEPDSAHPHEESELD